MKVAIMGGGAIGLLFAAHLSKKHDVTLYTRTEKQAEMIRSQGVALVQNNRTETFPIQAYPFVQVNGQEELVIIAVKEYHLHELMTSITSLHHSAFLFLQNGMGHLPILENLEAKNIFVGVVEHGAVRLDERTVHHTGIGLTRYGVWKGSLTHGLDDLAIPTFPFVFSENPLQMLKEKLLANCVINPLTALLAVPNGELLGNPFYYKLFLQTFNETVKALQLPNREVLLNKVKEICRQTAKNHSSMYKDLHLGRKTEIDAIVGSALKQAALHHVEAPILEFLYHSIKGKEGQQI
ncbi:ketopantoate reductase [Bacillus oleivorans]|uniref:2-dehydropantoate 2-reductase n=1 Tax=Bacillus oleivorans TaxID=1448271 RepID=A0A285D0S6_9BACI|nr:2-dehydropantoate 2-reductase [Bacillus oleivorans]SNX73410.1 ketopantoate reductase [Bacillus oleivorans]